jgi:hypothetical protein
MPKPAKLAPVVYMTRRFDEMVAWYRNVDRDPDSNRLELQVDAMPVDAANMYIASPAFAANPLGFVVDPETLLAEVTP